MTIIKRNVTKTFVPWRICPMATLLEIDCWVCAIGEIT